MLGWSPTIHAALPATCAESDVTGKRSLNSGPNSFLPWREPNRHINLCPSSALCPAALQPTILTHNYSYQVSQEALQTLSEKYCVDGGVKVWRRAAGVTTRTYGGVEVWRRCRRSATEVRRCGALEARCRRDDTEVWRCGARDAHCGCSDVDVWSSGGSL